MAIENGFANEARMNQVIKQKAQLMGEYLITLSSKGLAMCGQRVKVISSFVESPFEISKHGYKEFITAIGADLPQSKRHFLTDFLFFCGIKIGGVRKRKNKVVERMDTLSKANQEKISAFIAWCMKQKDYSEATLRMKRDQLKMFFRYFNEFNLDNCRSFIATMEHEGKHPKTLNMYMLTLRHYGEFVRKPVTLKKIGVPNSMSTENVPTEAEYRKLLEYCRENEIWKIYWPVRILGSTGMRRSELIQATWHDVLNGGFFPRCKGKKHRSIYFPKQLVTDLRKWLKNTDRNYNQLILWCERTDSPYSDRGFDQSLKRIAMKAGFPIEKAHCHAFRHFFAKQYLSKTKDVIQLAELLGHESVDTTRLYLQKSKQEQIRDVNKFVNW